MDQTKAVPLPDCRVGAGGVAAATSTVTTARAASSSSSSSVRPVGLSPSWSKHSLGSNNNKRPAAAALPPSVTEHHDAPSFADSSGTTVLRTPVVKRLRLCSDGKLLVVEKSELQNPSLLAASMADGDWADSSSSRRNEDCGLFSCAIANAPLHARYSSGVTIPSGAKSTSATPNDLRSLLGMEAAEGGIDVSFHGDDENVDYQSVIDSLSCGAPPPSSTPQTPYGAVQPKPHVTATTSQWLFRSHDDNGRPRRNKNNNSDDDRAVRTASSSGSSSLLLESRATHHPIRLFEHSPGSLLSSPSSTSSSSSNCGSAMASGPSRVAPPPPSSDRSFRHQASSASSSQSLLSTRTNAGDSVQALADHDESNSSGDSDQDEEVEQVDNEAVYYDTSSRNGRRPSTHSPLAMYRGPSASDRSSTANMITMAAGSLSPTDENDMEGVVATIDALTESVQSWSLVKVRNGPSRSATSGGDDNDQDDVCLSSRHHRQVQRQNARSAKKHVMRVLRSSASSSSSTSSLMLPTYLTTPPASLPLHHYAGPVSHHHHHRSRRESSSPTPSSTSTESHQSISSFFSVASSTRMLEG